MIAKNLMKREYIEKIPISEIYCKGNAESAMHRLVLSYQSVMAQQDSWKYTHNLPEQAYSHVYLIKYIAAAFAFERYKLQYENTPISIDDYSVPLNNLLDLNEHFTSTSYSMRRALFYLNQYHLSNDKPTFCFLGDVESFQQYFVRVFMNS